MTGIYMRINRNGRWQNFEVEYLTAEERAEHLGNRNSAELVRWIDSLCRALVKAEVMLSENEIAIKTTPSTPE